MKLIDSHNAESPLQMQSDSVRKVCRVACQHPVFTIPTLVVFLRIGFFLAMILFLFSIAAQAEIKNGYEKDILMLRESLKNLTGILVEDKDLTGAKRRRIESLAENLVKKISYYDLTENLLSQFRIVAPELYAEIDTIADRRGRPVDVYVKFVPPEATDIRAWGATYICQVENDADAYLSEYGPFTVSIKIWIVSKALQVLSHEFGHVKYQIPNLASYITFHKKYYTDKEARYFGHHSDDPSGKMAIQTEKIFRREYTYFQKNSHEKIQNPVVLFTKIRKSMSPKHYASLNVWRPTLTL